MIPRRMPLAYRPGGQTPWGNKRFSLKTALETALLVLSILPQNRRSRNTKRFMDKKHCERGLPALKRRFCAFLIVTIL
jgi:hypothetical protein